MAAKAAYLEAFDETEVSQSFQSALAKDFNAEISEPVFASVNRILDAVSQIDMFPGQEIKDLERLRAQYCTPMEASFISSAQQALHEGQSGSIVVEKIVEDTLKERGLAAIRQVEEHMVREAPGSAQFMRSRLENVLQTLNYADVTKSALGEASLAKDMEKRGLDEGVPL